MTLRLTKTTIKFLRWCEPNGVQAKHQIACMDLARKKVPAFGYKQRTCNKIRDVSVHKYFFRSYGTLARTISVRTLKSSYRTYVE